MHGFLRELWQWLSGVNIIGIIATYVQFLVVSLDSMDEYEPASSHLRKGLTVLQMLPDTPARLQHELALQTTLGPALIATKGYGVSEVAQAYTWARELCQQMGETPDVFPVLRGLWVFHEVRAELQVARELAEQLLVLAQRLQDPVYLIEAYRALGGTLFWLGQFAPARVYLEQAIALYDVQQHRSLAFLYGTDPAVVCPSYAALALWLLSYSDQGRRRSTGHHIHQRHCYIGLCRKFWCVGTVRRVSLCRWSPYAARA